MTPAPSAGGEEVKKKRKRRRSRSASKRSQQPPAKNQKRRQPYAKRVDETSAGGLVIDRTGTQGLLIGRLDIKDQSREKLLWSLPKGHIEEGETPEQAAVREVHEETGIECSIDKSLGVIDFWFMAGGKRIHKTVHHFVFRETGGRIAPQVSEVDDVRWFPIEEIVERLAYPDERKLIARSQDLLK
ncbi:MAG: NUDIX hydrolase [Actinobacteria bacterium]|jgi:8-oxo-dGTP pyrophosphatase MutT (NUDIX family)|nr:NUDIX hydrolase [Actinomycetota bacterium]